MGEESKRMCPYCWHDFHGAVEAIGSHTGFPRTGTCPALILDGRRECMCDGRTQWFSNTGDREEVETWAHQAAAAGYSVYVFNSNDIAVRLVGSDGKYTDDWTATVFSETLPPVASPEEFNQRIGLSPTP